MKKEIIYLTEYLSKSQNVKESEPYEAIFQALSIEEVYVPSKYDQTKIIALMKHQQLNPPINFEEAVIRLDKVLELILPEEIARMKKSVFLTLMASNFPKKKGFLEHSYALFISQLEPVEKSIFDNLTSYILCLNRGLGIFYSLYHDEKKMHQPEVFIAFGNSLHVELMNIIYNEEEKKLLGEGLKSLLIVYLGMYGKHLYI